MHVCYNKFSLIQLHLSGCHAFSRSVYYRTWTSMIFDHYAWHTMVGIRYTARQLCGITLLVPPLFFIAGGNLCQCQYKALDDIQKTFRDPWQTFMLIITFFLSRLAFLGSADFPKCPKGIVVRLCWSHSGVSHRCMQITIWNQSGNHANK